MRSFDSHSKILSIDFQEIVFGENTINATMTFVCHFEALIIVTVDGFKKCYVRGRFSSFEKSKFDSGAKRKERNQQKSTRNV